MAIWQYSFQVLPKDGVNTLFDGHFLCSNDDAFEDELFWKKYPVKKTLFYGIDLILKKAKSWSNNIDLYGDQKSNCFEVLSDDNGNVISVSFRISFRSKYEIILNDLIEFCILNGLIILDENLNFIPLNCEQIRTTIEASPQMRMYDKLSREGKNSRHS